MWRQPPPLLLPARIGRRFPARFPYPQSPSGESTPWERADKGITERRSPKLCSGAHFGSRLPSTVARRSTAESGPRRSASAERDVRRDIHRAQGHAVRPNPNPTVALAAAPRRESPPPTRARHRRKPHQPARRGRRNGALRRGAPTERGRAVGEPAQPMFLVFSFENSLPSITTPDPDPAAPHAPQAKVHAHCGEHRRRARCSVDRPRRRAGDDKPPSTGRTCFLS